MRALALALFCGNSAATLLSLFFPSWLLILALLLLWFRHPIVIWLLVALFANLCVGWTLHAYQEALLPDALQGKVVTATVLITEPVVDQGELSRRFAATLSGITEWPGEHAVLVSWYGKGPALKPGEYWQLPLKVKQPHGLKNPGARDRLKWYAEQGIVATATVRAKGPFVHLPFAGVYPVQRFRQALAAAMTNALPQQDTVGMLQGLTIGLKQGITQAQWQMLLVTGTNHLLAISGLHIGLVFGLCYKLGSWCWRRSFYLCGFITSVRAGLLIAGFFAVFYALLAGLSVSTERSLIMLAVFSFARWQRSGLGLSHSFAMAVLLVLLYDPLATWSMSFWFSFAAVFSLAYGMQGIADKKARLQNWMKPQWVVGLFLLPLSLYCFQTSSVIGLVANAIAIPWVSFLVVPLGLLGVAFCWLPFIANSLWWCAALLLQILTLFLNELAAVPYAQILLAINSVWVLLCAQLAVFLWLAPSALRSRLFAAFFCLPLITYAPAKIPLGRLRLSILDVGQGLSVLVETQNHVLLYDTGPPFGPELDAAGLAILPYLRWRHVTAIDTLVVSHADNDHSGGVNTLRMSVPVKQVLASVPQKVRGAFMCRAGLQWQWDGVHFALLHPDDSPFWEGNNACCVLKITADNVTVLLPGDIERAAEQHLVQTHAAALKADILIAAHHGSKTSSLLQFIEAVQPKRVIFSTGYQNRFHFPHPLVVARYQQQQVVMDNTAKSGALVVE